MHLTANLPGKFPLKKIVNRLRFDRIMVMSLWLRFYRAMLCIRGTSHGPVTVRPSVRPSQVGVLLKRLKAGSHKQHHTIAQGLQFSDAKDLRESAKFDRGHPLRGRRMQVGWVKIGDFRQIAGYISRKRYKIDAWFLLKSNRKSYALYRMLTLPLTSSAP